MYKRKFIFHIRAHNDCDHFMPIMWRLLNEGHNIVIIPMYGFQAHQDYRIKFLIANFKHLLIFEPSKFYIRKSTYLYKFYNFFNHKNNLIKMVFFLINLPFKLSEHSIFKDNPLLIWDYGAPGRISHFEGLIYSLKTVVLPHGIDIFTNKYHDEKADFSNRSIYDHYLIDSALQKEIAVNILNMKEKTLHVIGSSRFSKEWIEVLFSFVDKFSFGPFERKKIVYFLPHSNYDPRSSDIINTINAIRNLKNISLVIKQSTRQKNIFFPDAMKELDKSDNLLFDDSTPSIALIDWSDIVINHGSSIVFDAFQMHKVVIHACFLDGLSTIFDADESVYAVNTIEEVCEIIDSNEAYPAKDASKMIKKYIYNDHEEPPLDYLYNFLIKL